MEKIQAVIFDVDGVLLDSLHSNAYFLQKLLEKFGYPGFSVEHYRKIHFYSMRDVIRSFTGLSDEKEIQKIWQAGKSFDAKGPPAKMTAKASDVIKELHKKYPLGIVTNRVRGHIFEIPEMKEIETLFTGVVGYEDTEKHKPDPEPLFLSAKKMGVAPNKCVFIGDAETDMQAGQAAGMKTILYLPDSFPQIPSQIEELMS